MCKQKQATQIEYKPRLMHRLQVKSELLHLVLHYAEKDFPPMGTDHEDNPDNHRIAEAAIALFLSCRWSRMSIFDMAIIRNAIRIRYPPEDTPPLGIRHAHTTLDLAVEFLSSISRRRNYCLELCPPVYRNSDQQNVYTLSRPPAKASYNGLSLSAYEKLMDIMMRDEMYEAR